MLRAVPFYSICGLVRFIYDLPKSAFNCITFTMSIRFILLQIPRPISGRDTQYADIQTVYFFRRQSSIYLVENWLKTITPHSSKQLSVAVFQLSREFCKFSTETRMLKFVFKFWEVKWLAFENIIQVKFNRVTVPLKGTPN